MQTAALSPPTMTNGHEEVNLQIVSRDHDLGMIIEEPEWTEINLKGIENGLPKTPHVAYLRVSTQDQSVVSQVEQLEYLIKSKGLDPRPCYEGGDIVYLVEHGVSAWKAKTCDLADRPFGKYIVDWVSNGDLENVFGYKVNRMFRSMAHGHMFCWNLKHEWKDSWARRCDLITCDVPMGYYGKGGKQAFAVLVMLAETSSDEKSDATCDGMRAAAKSGRRTTKAIYGWDIDEASGQMVPNWDEQSVKAWARMWNGADHAGLSWTKIAKGLNELNMKGKLGGKWDASRLKRTCTNCKQDEFLFNYPKPNRMPSHPWTNYRKLKGWYSETDADRFDTDRMSYKTVRLEEHEGETHIIRD